MIANISKQRLPYIEGWENHEMHAHQKHWISLFNQGAISTKLLLATDRTRNHYRYKKFHSETSSIYQPLQGKQDYNMMREAVCDMSW